MKRFLAFALLITLSYTTSFAQFTAADSLRGSITPERAWWDLLHYDLNLEVFPESKSFEGHNTIRYKVLSEAKELQVDLQPPLKITKVTQNGKDLKWESRGPNAHFIKLQESQAINSVQEVTVHYAGVPVEAKRAPWDGGIVWQKDKQGMPFIASACQGIGASVWWPNKDHMADEVDSMKLTVTAPNGLWNAGNGRLTNMKLHPDGRRTTEWTILNPINNYGVNINIANYAFWSDTYKGEKGDLPISFWVLPEDLKKAKDQFQDAYKTLEAFEHWFGPYPFYEDGYKLVQAPYLGMEHQSSVTYGNGFQNGYRGRSLSESKYGELWDFIIVHESGHEWFANNVTYKDMADMWIHESFTNYSESLFTEYWYGKDAGAEYVRGTRRNIANDKPIIAPYGVNAKGSGDMYYKGGNMLHMIRQIGGDDEKWRSILRGINETFYHQTVTTDQIEDYITDRIGVDLSSLFDQYLRQANIPSLEVKVEGKKLCYRFADAVSHLTFPVEVMVDGETMKITPTTEWQKVKGDKITLDEDYYINFIQQAE